MTVRGVAKPLFIACDENSITFRHSSHLPLCIHFVTKLTRNVFEQRVLQIEAQPINVFHKINKKRYFESLILYFKIVLSFIMESW